MRMSRAFFKIEKAELIEQRSNRSFEFIYLKNWLNTKDKIAISLMLPKSKQVYQSLYLFPFFNNVLPKGINKHGICKKMYNDKMIILGCCPTMH